MSSIDSTLQFSIAPQKIAGIKQVRSYLLGQTASLALYPDRQEEITRSILREIHHEVEIKIMENSQVGVLYLYKPGSTFNIKGSHLFDIADVEAFIKALDEFCNRLNAVITLMEFTHLTVRELSNKTLYERLVWVMQKGLGPYFNDHGAISAVLHRHDYRVLQDRMNLAVIIKQIQELRKRFNIDQIESDVPYTHESLAQEARNIQSIVDLYNEGMEFEGIANLVNRGLDENAEKVSPDDIRTFIKVRQLTYPNEFK